jgi:kinesin family protein 6/9
VHAAGAGHAYASAAAAAMPPPVSAAELVAKREHVALVVEKVGASGTEEAEALLQRNAAFEAFRRSYRKNEVIEENKLLLKQKYDEAKALGEACASLRCVDLWGSKVHACNKILF